MFPLAFAAARAALRHCTAYICAAKRPIKRAQAVRTLVRWCVCVWRACLAHHRVLGYGPAPRADERFSGTPDGSVTVLCGYGRIRFRGPRYGAVPLVVATVVTELGSGRATGLVGGVGSERLPSRFAVW
mgnify:CR=1 FL=1